MSETMSADPVKIDAVKVEIPVLEKAATTAYWIGVTEKCPYRPVTVAGLDFPYEVTPPRQSPDGEWYLEHMRGKVVSLSDADVEKVKAAVVRKVVRWNNKKTKGWLLATDSVTYAREANDEPLAKYLYMIRMGNGPDPVGFRRTSGEPML